MNARTVRTLLVLPGLVVLAATILVPMTALIARSFQAGLSDSAGAFPSPRQLGLFGKSFWMAARGATLALLIAMPAAFVIGLLGQLRKSPALGALLLTPLLLPPMVYAFGWQQSLGRSLQGEGACLLVWAGWAWPIPAVLIGGGWAKRGRDAYEAALLVSPRGTAFGQVVLPLLGRNIVLAWFALFVVFLTEYSVPHANGLIVLSTELLGWASQSNNPADVLIPSLPVIGTVLLALGLMMWLWNHQPDGPSEQSSGSYKHRRWCWWILVTMVAGSAGLPIGILVWKFKAWQLVPEAVATYPSELAASLGIAAISGIITLVSGISLASVPSVRRWLLPLLLLFGLLPGALIGESVLVAYSHVRIIYHHWPLLAIGCVARYGWVGIFVAWLAASSTEADLVDQARSDGASESAIIMQIRYLPNLALLLCGSAIVASLSLADAALGTMLTVPGIGPISAILLQKFHQLEDGMLVALSLWLIIASLPALILVWVALRLQQTRLLVRR